MLVHTGESGHGLTLILAGEVDITRADSVKRVASAVGDGAQVVAALHAYLAQAPAAIAAEPLRVPA